MREHDWYYDNDEEAPLDADLDDPNSETTTCWIAVERIYRLDWRRFTSEGWETLRRIYQVLPGHLPSSADSARWFSLDEERELYLWASVEPPGLQVEGVLTLAMWHDWDSRFRRKVIGHDLPRTPLLS